MAAPVDVYPPSPTNVPADLTKPTRAYVRHAWLTVAGLLGFVALYGALIAWFATKTYRLATQGARGTGTDFFGVVLAAFSGTLLLFLVRGLFYVRHQTAPGRVEVTEAEQPRLFAFVRRIAADAGAPAPHRIYLSPHVNAAVFYDLSILNLVLPTKKNLEIGLGLAQVLTLSELKAVLAHEFGHFAQRTMAIGRWVYMAQQVVGHLVEARGRLDGFLEGLSRIDLRLAWVGWLLRILVWSMRSLLDTAFRGIVLLQRALSREMELQADLVSVSLCGSDSLVHALYRSQSADEAWDVAVSIMMDEARAGRRVDDLFALQSHVERRRAAVKGTEAELSPPAPAAGADPAAHRVFAAELAQPPKMWSTHPPNHEREANAKRRYLPAAPDDRPSWAVFEDAPALRRQLTEALYDLLAEEEEDSDEGEPKAPFQPAPLEETLQKVDALFDRPHLDRRYRGAYLGRSCVLGVAEPDGLWEPDGPATADDVRARLELLYPESLQDELQRWREACEEHALLEGLKDGFLTAPGGVIQFRGRQVPKKELHDLLAEVGTERDSLRERLEAHDRAVRTAHRQAAAASDPAWAAYLEGLARFLHCVEHTRADLDDMHDYLVHVLNVVMADGRVTKSELSRLRATGTDAWTLLDGFLRQRSALEPAAAVLEKLEVESVNELFPSARFELTAPSDEDFAHGWLGAIDSWYGAVTGALGALSNATLQALVEAEAHVADAARAGQPLGAAPRAPRCLTHYPRRCLDTERPREKRLDWWNRFQLADGWGPGVTRFFAASAVLGAALFAGEMTGTVEVHLHNGLAVAVQVQAGPDATETVLPHQTAQVRLTAAPNVTFVAQTVEGAEIERFDVDLTRLSGEPVYNVAGASALVELTASYGSAAERAPRKLGNPRWLEASSDHLFEDPPESVSLSRSQSGTTRTALVAIDDVPPWVQADFLAQPAQIAPLAAAHIRWDPAEDDAFLFWLGAEREAPAIASALEARIAATEDPDVSVLRAFMDAVPADRRAELCADFTARARHAPGDADLAYLRVRCLPDGPAQDAEWRARYGDHPNHPWLARAASDVFEAHGDYAAALTAATRAGRAEPGLQLELGRAILRQARVVHDAYLPEVDAFGAEDRYAPLAAIEESGSSPDPDYEGFADLQSGALTAHGRARSDLQKASLLRLAGASWGATDAQVTDAIRQCTKDASRAHLVLVTAAARRAGLDEGPCEDALLAREGDEAPKVLELVAAETLASPALPTRLDGLALSWRGAVYGAAATWHGDEVRPAYLAKARRMLLLSEQAYWGPRAR